MKYLDEDYKDSPFLFGSEELTREEEALRLELIRWCRQKIAFGARPVPLFAALTIVLDIMKDQDRFDEYFGDVRFQARRGAGLEPW